MKLPRLSEIPLERFSPFAKSVGLYVFKWLKDPSNLLFVGGGLLVITFVSMTFFDNKDTSLLVDASNSLDEKYQKKEYSGTIWNKFYVSIPQAEVSRAEVTTNVKSTVESAYMPILEKSVAHYQGSAYPGQKGNVFLYGHSVLPQFYNPLQYKTIFSRLHNVDIGDHIYVEWGDDKFDYIVVDKKVVNPNDLKAITFSRNSKVLSVMTCNPPGTYLKRLIVEAEQVSHSSVSMNNKIGSNGDIAVSN